MTTDPLMTPPALASSRLAEMLAALRDEQYGLFSASVDLPADSAEDPDDDPSAVVGFQGTLTDWVSAMAYGGLWLEALGLEPSALLLDLDQTALHVQRKVVVGDIDEGWWVSVSIQPSEDDNPPEAYVDGYTGTPEQVRAALHNYAMGHQTRLMAELSTQLRSLWARTEHLGLDAPSLRDHLWDALQAPLFAPMWAQRSAHGLEASLDDAPSPARRPRM